MSIKTAEIHEGYEDCLNVGEIEITRPYHLSGLGQTVEQHFRCKICGREYREVYLYSCTLEETD